MISRCLDQSWKVEEVVCARPWSTMTGRRDAEPHDVVLFIIGNDGLRTAEEDDLEIEHRQSSEPDRMVEDPDGYTWPQIRIVFSLPDLDVAGSQKTSSVP